eukprot:1226073-Amphidinium_carterae.1
MARKAKAREKEGRVEVRMAVHLNDGMRSICMEKGDQEHGGWWNRDKESDEKDGGWWASKQGNGDQQDSGWWDSSWKKDSQQDGGWWDSGAAQQWS